MAEDAAAGVEAVGKMLERGGEDDAMGTSRIVFLAFVIMAMLAMVGSACGDGSDTGSGISKFIPPPLAEGIELIPIAPTLENQGALRSLPVIDGNIVVWEELGISGYDLSAKTEFLVSSSTEAQWPAVGGNVVVWEDEDWDGSTGKWRIYGYDLVTKTQFPVCPQSGDQFSPAISGDIVVWSDYRNGNGDIYGYDLSTGTEFAICTDPALQGSPRIDGQIVVWEDNRNTRGDPGVWNFDIYGYDLSTKTEFPICTNPAPQSRPDVSGNIVVWQDNRNSSPDIYGYDLSTETEFIVCNNSDHQTGPSISGDIVVWEDKNILWTDDVYAIEAGLYGYDLSTETEFTICPHGRDYAIETPSISGSIVVWRYQSPRGASEYIYGARLP